MMHASGRVCGFILSVIFLGAVIASLIVGIAEVLDPADADENLSVTLSIWLVVWGSVGFVLILVACCDYCKKEKGPDFFTWVWGLLAIFLLYPWTLVGQNIILHGRDYAVNDGEWGVSIFVLVVTYLFVVGALGYGSWRLAPGGRK